MTSRQLGNAIALAAVCIAAATPALRGAEAPAESTQTQSAPAADTVQLNFPENFEVKLLIDYVSQRCHVNILYDDAIVRKRVTLSSPSKVPSDSLMNLLSSVLKMTGLALVEGEQPGWL